MNSMPHVAHAWRLPCALALSLCACQVDWHPLYDETMPEGLLSTVEIASSEVALTFARANVDGAAQTLLVRSYAEGEVIGIPASELFSDEDDDAIALYNAHGWDEIHARFSAADPTLEVRVEVDRLLMPIALGDHHIAAGTNFPEHADEAGVEEGPYLFPKVVTPTPAKGEVSAGQALLDYEVELGFVALRELREGDTPETMGLILCNDFSDRVVLLRNVNVDNVESGDGFTSAKSKPGYMPVGDLFVIPRDIRSYSDNVELSLYVNQDLRQRSLQERAVWGLDEILSETWKRRDWTWSHLGEEVALFPEEPAIAAGTVLLGGTPSGVVFNELNIENMASGFFDWLVFGWGDSIPDHAIDNYIRDAKAAGIYLQPGDVVSIHVPHLGVLRTEVTR